MVLEKTLESPLDCKEIQPVHPEGDQLWDFFGRNDAKAETVDSLEKTLMQGGIGLLGTRLLGGGKTERRPPAPALGPGSELLQSSDLEEPRPAGISHPERELRPSTRGRQGRCCPCDAGARTCTWPTSSSRPKQGYVRGQTLPNQKRGKKVIPCPCMSRKPRGKQAAEKAGSRALGRFFKSNGPDWTLRQGSAHCPHSSALA